MHDPVMNFAEQDKCKRPGDAEARVENGQNAGLPPYEDVLARIWAFALRLSNDEGEAARLVEQAYQRELNDSNASQTSTILLRLYKAIHSAWEHARREGKAPARDTGPKWQPSIAAKGSSLHSKIIAAVGCLPDAERVVILLSAVEGLGNDEIAVILGITLSVVSDRLIRAIRIIGEHAANWQNDRSL
ncbi:RNA polymerase sigma-54 factor RpoN [Caballeronia glathei]|nr:sigma factor-like helix-turn-helix DNA-binding protein [Caballeronia glathei]CDY77235.1 RNA polymerase sigma-54 factor RpoN [Caballeronia glathei]